MRQLEDYGELVINKINRLFDTAEIVQTHGNFGVTYTIGEISVSSGHVRVKHEHIRLAQHEHNKIYFMLENYVHYNDDILNYLKD